MPSDFAITTEQATALKAVEKAYSELVQQPIQSFSLYNLQNAVNKFATTLPPELVALAEKSWDEGEDDLLYETYEYYALLSGYILNDFRALQSLSVVGDVGNRLNEFANDLYQAVTYSPEWDSNHGTWR